MSARPITHVAVGVVVRHDGALLMADRPAGKPYPGYWEFPGGKIEAGESVHAALARELHEELGIQVSRSWPWAVLDHEYPHAHVRLHFRRVLEWEGEPHAREGQRLLFLAPGASPPEPLLPAAVPALRWARLPTCIGLLEPGADALARLPAAIERGLRLLAAPAPSPGDAAEQSSWAQAGALARSRSVHLLGFGDRDELALACGPGPDFRVLSRDPGGGPAFAQWRALARDAPLPVYLVCEPSPAALRDAWAAGATGIAVAW